MVKSRSIEAQQFGFRAIPAPGEAPQAARAWRVVHACDSLRQVLPVVEAQAAAGIKPYVLTPQGQCLDQSGFRDWRLEIPKPASLLKTWSEVRNWRRNFLSSEVEAGLPAADADLVHAHCFSAGMTAVRNSPAVVYSLYDFIENLPHCHGSKDHSWLLRSFAVAEQFVFTRAGAVVVQSECLRNELLRRGCAAENVFLIPEPLSTPVMEFLLEPQPAFVAKRKDDDAIVFFAPDICLDGAHARDGSAVAASPASQPSTSQPWTSHPMLSRNADCLLEAFARVRREIRRARLFVAATPACAAVLLEKSTALGIADAIFAVSSADCGRAFAEADVIIALGDGLAPRGIGNSRLEPGAEAAAESPSASIHLFGEHIFREQPSGDDPSAEPDSSGQLATRRLSAALAGMIAGVTLLAADTPVHRDLSLEGRGLLWFRPEDARDLAARAVFLARNPELCVSLAAAARQHLIETRSPQAVGCQYDTVYQYVFARRKPHGPTPTAGRLQPLTASL